MADNTTYPQEFLEQLKNPKKKSPPDVKTLIIIGGGILAILLLGLSIIGKSLRPTKVDLSDTIARAQAFDKIAKQYHTKIYSSSLRAANGNFRVTLANFVRDATDYRLSQFDKKAKSKEKALPKADLSDVEERLTTAELNNQLDRTYIIELNYQINLFIAEHQKMQKTNKNAELHKILAANLSDLRKIQEQLKEISLD